MTRWVRVVSAVIGVRNVESLRVSAISARGSHRRLPLLVHSHVGSVDIMYWRKTIVTGALPDGKVLLRLRIPHRVLRHHQGYTLRVRALGPTGIRTTYLHFRR